MIHVHPFPARMAPEIAFKGLLDMSPGDVVLDPMAGSGMVLSVAARKGFRAIGTDMDPLAKLIAQVGARKVSAKAVREELDNLLDVCKRDLNKKKPLAWMDSDRETSEFVDYWFAPKQMKQLRSLSYYLVVAPAIKEKKVLEVIKVALSRLIITKEPKASLARDTAHSRPHRTISENSFDIFSELPRSVEHVLKALAFEPIKVNAKTYLDDSRVLSKVKDSSVDSIITSPPYLNAIDYMRGHKFSLVWLGYRISDLRSIRAESIGSERAPEIGTKKEFTLVSKELNLETLPARQMKMLERYFYDLCAQTKQSFRVLKTGKYASYVIGNSEIRGTSVLNNELLKHAAFMAGFVFHGEEEREIPTNKRYLPFSSKGKGSLSKRMKTEHIISFVKR